MPICVNVVQVCLDPYIHRGSRNPHNTVGTDSSNAAD